MRGGTIRQSTLTTTLYGGKEKNSTKSILKHCSSVPLLVDMMGFAHNFHLSDHRFEF